MQPSEVLRLIRFRWRRRNFGHALCTFLAAHPFNESPDGIHSRPTRRARLEKRPSRQPTLNAKRTDCARGGGAVDIGQRDCFPVGRGGAEADVFEGFRAGVNGAEPPQLHYTPSSDSFAEVDSSVIVVVVVCADNIECGTKEMRWPAARTSIYPASLLVNMPDAT